MGGKPDNWDRLPNNRPNDAGLFAGIRYRKTKMDIIAPYLDQIGMLVGHRWLRENKGRNLSLKDSFDLLS